MTSMNPVTFDTNVYSIRVYVKLAAMILFKVKHGYCSYQLQTRTVKR